EAATCTMASQSDWRKCEDLLDCWQTNDCGPTDYCTTSANEGACHVNRTGASSQQAQQLAAEVRTALCQ
ncbi:MAG: hypothetical protein MK135_11925, partial [Polyangiaceae bacterium]|nr:hypothetical protein [Polyangiaceae bacterium]